MSESPNTPSESPGDIWASSKYSKHSLDREIEIAKLEKMKQEQEQQLIKILKSKGLLSKLPQQNTEIKKTEEGAASIKVKIRKIKD